MKSSHKTLLIIVICVVAAVGGLIALSRKAATGPGQYDSLAQCLTEKGVKFYGAYWCPHCAEQKRLFGKSMSYITYIECGVPGNQRGMTQACEEAKIESYPTWIFPDGTRMTGEQFPQKLAEKAGCEIDKPAEVPPVEEQPAS